MLDVKALLTKVLAFISDSKSSAVSIQYTSAVTGGFGNKLLVRGDVLYVTIGGSVKQTTGWTNTNIATINGAVSKVAVNIPAQKNDGTVRLIQITEGTSTIVLRNLDNVSSDDSFRAFLAIPITFT